MYLKTSKTKRRKVSSYLWSHTTRKRRTTVFKHTPLKRPWKDSICQKTSFNLYYRVWTKQQAVLKRFMDLLKTSRLKRLSDRVIRCHLSFTFSLWTLHEGWKNNPLYHRETGYCFSNDKTLTISSTGYADDAMIYAETWDHIWTMNQWTREFCRAHGFKISQKLNISSLIAKDRMILDGSQPWTVRENFTPNPLTSNSDI